jgi:hypothetical protein
VNKCYAISIDVKPTHYADSIHNILELLQDIATPSDQDDELLIYDSLPAYELAQRTIASYSIQLECLTLIQLPAEHLLSRWFTDYGFTSLRGQTYVYQHLIFIFRISEPTVHSEPTQALMQLEEYVLCQFTWEDQVHYIVDKQHHELVTRIAQAYHCDITPLQ